jgi:uncharacterized protein YbaR (Trm112 family)
MFQGFKAIFTAMPAPQSEFDPKVLDQLACPACLGNLHLEDARLVCASCRRAYPIVDGIPALIVEKAGTTESA